MIFVSEHLIEALVPKPMVNLTRYHGVLAPNHRWRGEVTPARRGKRPKAIANTEIRSPVEHHAAMTWAQRSILRVLKFSPDAPSIRYRSAMIATALKDNVTARATLENLLTANPKFPEVAEPKALLATLKN